MDFSPKSSGGDILLLSSSFIDEAQESQTERSLALSHMGRKWQSQAGDPYWSPVLLPGQEGGLSR